MEQEHAIEGRDDELVDRLIDAIDCDDWIDLTWYVAFAINGSELMRLTPDTGRAPEPGTVGSELAKTHIRVSRTDYLAAIRRRMLELVDAGIREDVLVAGLRDDVSRQLAALAATDRTESRRVETRKVREEWAQDSGEIERFRSRMAKTDPSYASRSDAEIGDDLRRMASRLGPIPLEQELGSWARADRWNDRAADFISDVVLDEWLSAKAGNS